MEELVSIVIPIYNVELFLERCLSSITSQTYQNLEIILVDDGSTDSSPNICDSWASKDSRIKVIHKSNAGLGMARNTGIDNASGRYICFFDSDDYIALETIETALNTAKKYNADIVAFGMSVVNQHGAVTKTFTPESEKDCYRGEEVLNCFLPGLLRSDGAISKIKNISFSAWSLLYSADLIKSTDWRFVSEREIISEDVYSLLSLYKNVNCVAIAKQALYFYCENDNSLTRVYRNDRFDKIKIFYKKCIQLCENYGYPTLIQRGCMCQFLGNIVGAMKQTVAHFNRPQAIKLLKVIIDDDVLQLVVSEKINDFFKLRIRILLWSVMQKKYNLCYLLLWINNKISNR